MASVVEELHRIFKERGLTLSVAESCTGGLICHLLTQQPGASKFFYAGIVTYFTESKYRLLGVKRDLLDSAGVVSPEVAKEMALRVRGLTLTDYSLSTTGNLGPEVMEQKPAGLIYFGLSSAEETIALEGRFSGSRLEIKEKAAFYGLGLLLDFVKGVIR